MKRKSSSIRSLPPESSSFALRLLWRLAAFAVAATYIFAGAVKIHDPSDFELSLLHTGMFPDWTIGPITYAVPCIEIIGGALCLSRRAIHLALPFLLVLTGIYTALLGAEWMRGIDPDCGCFGQSSKHWPYLALFLRNGVLMGAETCLIVFMSAQPRIDSRSGTSLGQRSLWQSESS